MKRIIFRNANLLTGDAPAQQGMSVVVKGDRIDMVSADPPLPDDGDHVIDLAGRTLMPGMVLCHYHATYQDLGPTSLPVGMEAPPALQTLRAARHLRMALDQGFTGVVSAGAPYAIDAACKQGIADGLIEGPRIVAGSRDVSTTGHSQDGFAWHWGPGQTAQTNIVDGADAFRRAVREEIKRGAEIIKIFATPGHGIAGHRDLEVTREELAAAIETAHARGARVRAHIATKAAILTLCELGIDVIDHGDGLDEECIDRVIEKGIFFAPSMYYPHELGKLGTGPFFDEMNADLAAMRAILPRADQAGVKLVLGDDYGGLPLKHGDYGRELEFYVREIGIPCLSVIRWATRYGGEMLDPSGRTGVIAAGMTADMIVVQGDPSQDITLLRDAGTIPAVMKGGVFFRNDLPAAPLHGEGKQVIGMAEVV